MKHAIDGNEFNAELIKIALNSLLRVKTGAMTEGQKDRFVSTYNMLERLNNELKG